MPLPETAVQFRVYVGNEVGSAPDVTDFDPQWQCISVTHRIGGVMEAVIMRDLGRVGRMEDEAITDFTNRKVEIFAYGANDIRLKGMFWGELVQRQQRIETQESDTYIAKLRPYHFGFPSPGEHVWMPTTDEITHFQQPHHFNPIVDEKAHNNKDVTHGIGDEEADPVVEPLKYYPLIDPESGLSDVALEYMGTEAAAWTLPEVVAYFCWTVNADEEYVKNPLTDGETAEEVADDLGEVLLDPPEIKDLRLPIDQCLPFYLTRTLDPLGYAWTVDPEYSTEDEESHIEPRIRVFTRGHSANPSHKVTLDLDEIDGVVDQSNLLQCGLASSLEQMPVVLAGRPSIKQYEMTIPLWKGWETDATVTDDHESNPGRLWIANESWEYTDLREEIPLTDLNDGLGETLFVIRRRKMTDCLTQYSDQNNKKIRRPPFLQYQVGDGEWLPVPEEWGYRVLPDQIGVRFHTPPKDLLPDNVTVRITGTVQTDSASGQIATLATPQVEYEAFGGPWTTLDLSDRFHNRTRRTAGEYASVLTGDADTKDSDSELFDYLTRLAKHEQVLPISGSATVKGIDVDYRVGDVIMEITGRDIDLFATVDEELERYPQITGITWYPTANPPVTVLEINPAPSPEVV